MEFSYMDLLIMLRTSVEDDSIPEDEKAKILNNIDELEVELFKYSY